MQIAYMRIYNRYNRFSTIIKKFILINNLQKRFLNLNDFFQEYHQSAV